MSAVPKGRNNRVWKGDLNDKTIAFPSLALRGLRLNCAAPTGVRTK
jgi:hypothetical protein